MTSPLPSSMEQGSHSPRLHCRPGVSLAVLAGVCAAFAVLFLQVVRPLALPLFLAAVLAILAFPMHERLPTRYGGRRALSAFLIMASTILLLLGPATAGFVVAYRLSSDAVAWLNWSVRMPNELDNVLERVARLSGSDPDELRNRFAQAVCDGEQMLFRRAVQAVGGIFSFAVGLLLFSIAGFFFLRDGPAIVKAREELTPLRLEQDRLVRRRFAVVGRAVVLSTILAALAQAITLGLGLGLLEVTFGLGLARWLVPIVVLAFVLSMIPMVGPSVVWFPLAAWMLYEGHYAAGLILAAIGVIVVSNADNLVRMAALHGSAGMHPLLGLVSVLGGLHQMGILGVFVSPVIAGVLLTLLRILKQQLDQLEAAPPSDPVPAQVATSAVITARGDTAS